MMKQLIAVLLLAIALALPAHSTEEKLPEPVGRILDIRKVPHDTLSVHVQDVDSGEVVVAWHADEPRNPASTMKLLTTLVGLAVLGPTYQWETEVFALGEVADGKLDGDLLLRGGGDPFLVTERVWQMLRLVRQAGIHEIDGNLLIDDSYSDVPDYDPGAFDRQPLRAYNVAPNALLMNFKVVRYWFEPDHDRNAVRVWVDPPLENLRVENRLALGRGYCGGYQRGITITANEAIDKMTDISYDPQFGARPVKRMIHDELLTKLSKDILSGSVAQDSKIEIDFQDEQFVFSNVEK